MRNSPAATETSRTGSGTGHAAARAAVISTKPASATPVPAVQSAGQDPSLNQEAGGTTGIAASARGSARLRTRLAASGERATCRPHAAARPNAASPTKWRSRPGVARLRLSRRRTRTATATATAKHASESHTGSGKGQSASHAAGINCTAGCADDRERQRASATRARRQHVAAAAAHHPREERTAPSFTPRSSGIATSRAGDRVSQQEQIERREQERNDQQPAARRFELPVVQRVLPGPVEQAERDRGREQEREVRDRFEPLPEGYDERDGAADDEQPADQFAPEDVPLLHERGERRPAVRRGDRCRSDCRRCGGGDAGSGAVGSGAGGGSAGAGGTAVARGDDSRFTLGRAVRRGSVGREALSTRRRRSSCARTVREVSSSSSPPSASTHLGLGRPHAAQ